MERLQEFIGSFFWVTNKLCNIIKLLNNFEFSQADMFTKEARDRIKPGDNSILAHLLDSKDKYGLSINEINSMISEFLFGGIDTVFLIKSTYIN